MNFRSLIICLLAVAACRRPAPTSLIERLDIGTPQHPYPLLTNVPAGSALQQIISIETNAHQIVLHIRLAPNEALWGFGERFDTFNQRHHIIETWLVDAWGGGNRSYFAVPFFISSSGYGLFVNSTGKIRFDCGATKPDDLRIEIPDTGVEIYSFHGTPTEIVSNYTQLVGRPQPIPDWALTPWISRNSYLSAYDVDRTIDQMEQHNLKAGAVVLEGWAEGLQNFKFDPHRYPGAPDWINRLHARGYHIVCWETPSLWDSASTYPIAKKNAYLVLNPDGSELRIDWLENAVKLDFRKTSARDWWTELHEPLIAMGVDGFKTDGGERMPDEWFHNLHPFYYQRAVLDAFKSQNRQGMTFARSASAICAGNSAFWGGDQRSSWNDLPEIVRVGLNAAVSGFPFWGHDIGGYAGTPEKKLYLRWLELGAFSPIMQWHGTTPREPWYYDDETVRIAKFYLDLRWQLQPYLQALARNATSNGTPLWRPLFWEFPQDARGRNIDDEFLLGEDLLVAPVLYEFDERSVYLPAGTWVDVWTHETHTGPKRVLKHVALESIPVYARKGSPLLNLIHPPPAAPAIELNLAGQVNDRGVVPTQRFFKKEEYEKIFLTLANHSDSTITGEIALHLLPPFTALPSEQQLCNVEPHSEQRFGFYVDLPSGWPVGSYPIEITSPAGSNLVTLVKLPPWPQTPHDDGFIDLDKTNETVATFNFPVDIDARLHIGSSNGIQVWLNDAVVFDKQAYRSPERDEDTVTVKLRAGSNTIRVLLPRPAGSIGPNGFYLRVEQSTSPH